MSKPLTMEDPLLRKLLSVGNMMASILFNLAQDSQYKEHAKLMKQHQRDWDNIRMQFIDR